MEEVMGKSNEVMGKIKEVMGKSKEVRLEGLVDLNNTLIKWE